ncbi:MAG: DNA polymerase III subunit epsilon [Pseudomonadales bacterium]|nr:DNA polymerase III subunit epsilon [Pseudomonadales bacterium]MDP6473124.1 DNA polymerase III subunit epsilon [Pseudomonadales bacterium]MDP6826119.1 DNA polymerase III subunit epsilon [Pseudomonadales bacterium]MDP6971505.1 DNA polymerase III subunit epsilon [Pseudomonadales bacterium]
MSRQIVLDTETTGLEPELGHRVIEIGAVELVDRKLTNVHFHRYVNPRREIDDAALEVHGITAEFLADKPGFEEVAGEFVAFIEGAELIIHNAPFDVAFLDHEFCLLDDCAWRVERLCAVTDSLALARHKHPGQKNNLDALCRRYEVDNTARVLHGALLDAEILADVYLAMTGGQTTMFAQALGVGDSQDVEQFDPLPEERVALPVIHACEQELAAHEQLLDLLDENGGSVWRTNPAEPAG